MDRRARSRARPHRPPFFQVFSQYSSQGRVFALRFDVIPRWLSTVEMNAVKKLHTFGMGAVVATAAFSLFALTANAQQPPAAAPAAPGTVAPVKPVAPAPAAAKAPAVVKAPAAAPAAAAKPKSVVSECKGLDEAGCKAKPECAFITPTAVNAKTGKVPTAYCRKVAGVAAKAAKPAAPAAPAPAAAAAKPATPPAAAAAIKPTAPATATKQ